jgi:hypothetical protein
MVHENKRIIRKSYKRVLMKKILFLLLLPSFLFSQEQRLTDTIKTKAVAYGFRAINGKGTGERLVAFDATGNLVPATAGGTQDLNSVLGVGNTSALAINLTGNKTTTWHQAWGNLMIQQVATNNSFLSDNIFYNSGASSAQYKTTGPGSMLYFIDGGLQLRTIASGTGGTNATMLTRWNLSNDGEMTAYKGLSFSLTGETNRDVKISNVNSGTDNLGNLTFYPTSGTNVGAWYDFIPRGTGYGSTFKSGVRLWNTDYAADNTNYEGLTLSSAGTAGYVFNSISGGTGTVRPIHLQIATTDALLIAADRKITFNNDYTFPLSSGAPNQVLAMPGSGGQLVWVDPASGGGSGTVTSVSGSGGTTGLTLTGGAITTSGTLTLGGILAAANGGTGQSSYTTGDLLYASSSSALSKLAAGTSGYYLGANGAGSAPSWKPMPSGSGDATYAIFDAITSNATETTMTGSMQVSNGEYGMIEVSIYNVNSTSNAGYSRKFIMPYRGTSTTAVAIGAQDDIQTERAWGSLGFEDCDMTVVSNGAGDIIITVFGISGQTIQWRAEIKKYSVFWSS